MVERNLAYTPRELFVPFHNREQRYAAMACHRRMGKTVACINDTIIRALYGQRERARYAYVAPFRQQAKEVAWEYLKDFAKPFLAGAPRESELRVKLINDAWITLYGADNPDAMRGLYFDGVVIDEFGDVRPELMKQVIRPALADRKGWLTVIGTPKGRNQFFHTITRAELDPRWFHMIAPASMTGYLDEEELDELRQEMTAAEYAQEIECSFEANLEGTYYADVLDDIKGTQILETKLYDPSQQVRVATDLGFTDTCAWWFWQDRPDGVAVIDYYEDRGKSVAHYLGMLADKGYDYERIFLPHDSRARTFQTGLSTEEMVRNPHRAAPTRWALHERLPTTILPKMDRQDGINLARTILRRCYFQNPNCFTGLEALKHYRRAYDTKNDVFAQTPKHDWASNGADGFRYLAMAASSTRPNLAKTARARHTDEPQRTQVVGRALNLNNLFSDRRGPRHHYQRGRI